MTETTTIDEERSGVVATGSAEPGGSESPHPAVKDRLLLPLVLPVLCMIAVGMLAVNISRVFLAGDSTAALIAAVLITLSILGGASLLSALPRLRTSSLAMISGLVVVIVVSAGLLSLGPSLEHDEGGEPGGYVEPTGPAVQELAVEASSVPLSFDATEYALAQPGVTEVKLGGDTGHTLAFRKVFSGFLLGPTPNPPLSGKVDLSAGEFEIFCTVPGHAAAGMVATITVSG